MKDVLNFALTMPGAPSVMMVLMSMMLMLFVVSLAILITVIYFLKLVVIQLLIVISLVTILLDATPRLSAYFGAGSGSILRQYLRCTGTESRLVDCSSGSSSCTHIEDAGVTCLPTGKIVSI